MKSPKYTSVINRVLGICGFISLLVMGVLTCIDVILRKFFDSPFQFTMEVSGVLLVAFIAAAYAYSTFKGRHISIDTLTTKLPKKTQNIIIAVTDLVSVLILGLVCWRCIIQGNHLLKVGQHTPIVEIPFYPFLYFLALTMFITMTNVLINAIGTVREMRAASAQTAKEI